MHTYDNQNVLEAQNVASNSGSNENDPRDCFRRDNPLGSLDFYMESYEDRSDENCFEVFERRPADEVSLGLLHACVQSSSDGNEPCSQLGNPISSDTSSEYEAPIESVHYRTASMTQESQAFPLESSAWLSGESEAEYVAPGREAKPSYVFLNLDASGWDTNITTQRRYWPNEDTLECSPGPESSSVTGPKESSPAESSSVTCRAECSLSSISDETPVPSKEVPPDDASSSLYAESGLDDVSLVTMDRDLVHTAEKPCWSFQTTDVNSAVNIVVKVTPREMEKEEDSAKTVDFTNLCDDIAHLLDGISIPRIVDSIVNEATSNHPTPRANHPTPRANHPTPRANQASQMPRRVGAESVLLTTPELALAGSPLVGPRNPPLVRTLPQSLVPKVVVPLAKISYRVPYNYDKCPVMEKVTLPMSPLIEAAPSRPEMELNFSAVRHFPLVCTPPSAVFHKAYSDNLVNKTRSVESSFSQRREPWYRFTEPTVTAGQIARGRAAVQPRVRYPQVSTVQGLQHTTTPRFGLSGVRQHASNLAPTYFRRSASALPASRVLTPREALHTRSPTLVRSASLRSNKIGSMDSNITWRRIPA